MENQIIEIIFRVLILVFSIVVHEVSHGAVAYALGDSTAKDEGRLTLNPIPHIDPVGTLILPALIGFGWAKPVPYNPFNLRNQKWGPLFIGIAGPLSNILIAVVFGLFIHLQGTLAIANTAFSAVAIKIVDLNILLALFNLIPVPPLDGSRALFAFTPYSWERARMFLEAYGFFILLFLIFFTPFLSWTILPVAGFLFQLITGLSF